MRMRCSHQHFYPGTTHRNIARAVIFAMRAHALSPTGMLSITIRVWQKLKAKSTGISTLIWRSDF